MAASTNTSTNAQRKIARLPSDIREQLNQRLQDGELGKTLVEWLNTLPKVQAVLTAEFGGRPINEQNLTEWKQGGYRDWLVRQQALEFVRSLECNEDGAQAALASPLTDKLAQWLAMRYAAAVHALAPTEADPETEWHRLRE